MPTETINRIKSPVNTFATLPEPPKLAHFLKSGVLKREEAIAYDTATARWWDKFQHILKTQWLENQ